MIELAIDGCSRMRVERMRDWGDARARARAELGDPPLTATAAAVLASRRASCGAVAEAEAPRDEAARAGRRDARRRARAASTRRLARGAELYLDRFDEAAAHVERGVAGRARDRPGAAVPDARPALRAAHPRCAAGWPRPPELLDERDRGGAAAGNTQALAWGLFNRARWPRRAGDVAPRWRAGGGERRARARLDGGLVRGAWPRAGAARAGDTGAPSRCSARAGGDGAAADPRRVEAWASSCSRCRLAAAAASDAPAPRRPRPVAPTTGPALARARGPSAPRPRSRSTPATARRRRARARLGGAADGLGAPIEAGSRGRSPGRALAAAGDASGRRRELARAAAFDACGAGVTATPPSASCAGSGTAVHRRRGAAGAAATGVESLTRARAAGGAS